MNVAAANCAERAVVRHNIAPEHFFALPADLREAVAEAVIQESREEGEINPAMALRLSRAIRRLYELRRPASPKERTLPLARRRVADAMREAPHPLHSGCLLLQTKEIGGIV